MIAGLRTLGHDVQVLGLYEELRPLREMLNDTKPHVVFNLLEEFNGQPVLDYHMVAYLVLHGAAYTGCNPRGLVIARDTITLAKELGKLTKLMSTFILEKAFDQQGLAFKLVVDDGFDASVPSPGPNSSFDDTVAVEVVENSKPTADAGTNQTKDEGSDVSLNGSASFDPDTGDSLSFQWTQPGGTAVSLSSATSPTPTFDAPAVAPGGEALTFGLVVTDDDPVTPMSSAPDDVVINVPRINDPPRGDSVEIGRGCQ